MAALEGMDWEIGTLVPWSSGMVPALADANICSRAFIGQVGRGVKLERTYVRVAGGIDDVGWWLRRIGGAEKHFAFLPSCDIM